MDMVRKSRDGNRKVTDKQVLDIRIRHFAGEPKIKLANEFGVTRRTISNIVRRTVYVHLP
jgi:hypothetical protein